MRVRRPLAKFWPPRFLRYLLVWPLVRAYRRKTRTRLSWRLAGSHFATVLVSVVVICIVIVVAAVASATLSVARFDEVAYEAKAVADIVRTADRQTPLTAAETDTVLTLIATGAVAKNESSDVNIRATAGVEFKYVESISLVAPDGTIVASSDHSKRGRLLSAVDPEAVTIAQRALDPNVNYGFGKLSMRREGSSRIAGAYPVLDGSGTLIGAILLEKSRSVIPSGWGLLHLLVVFTVQFGFFLLVFVGVPALPVGIVFGIRRGRAISRPITNLAQTASAFAAGDLSARVADIRGQNEVAGLQHEFNRMADLVQSSVTNEAAQRGIAEQALAANRDLIANVSHELRTPVALIRGHLEALESDPSETRTYLRIALRETERLERLVDELFQLSRLEAQRIELDLAPFDAGSAVRSAVESLVEPARREAGLTLLASVEPGDLTCLGDRLRIEQVLLNLIRNAIHFTPEGGIILVTAGDGPNGMVRMTVHDTGVGIAPEDLPLVFDRFFRADRARPRAAGGAGLGLAIAREFVLAMGGSIAVDSAQDEGTVFTIDLPRPPRQPLADRLHAPSSELVSPK